MSYSDYGIQIPAGKISGEVTTLCPECSHTRKKSKEKCLGVNLDKKVWRCNHCGWSGFLKPEKIEYKKPTWHNKTELSDKVVKFFEDRGISQGTLKKTKITESVEWMPKAQKETLTINFNYFRNDELINIKYRGQNKDFKMYKDAELIFYNLDSIKDSDECFIVEGEMDALSLIESGYLNVVSVPNGATLGTNNLTYLDNCFEYFLNKKLIYLALDNDQAGRKLRDELGQRFGLEICKYIEFKDCKDANECLVKYGIQGIIESKNAAKDFPIEGVFTISDIDYEINDLYDFGLDKGVSTGIDGFNLNFVKGYITTITGIPNHGKSDFLDNICLHLKLNAGWNGAFYSPENKPTQLHFAKIARKITGKSWDGEHRLSKGELNDVKDFLNNSFWFIKPEKDFTLDSILKSVRQLKQRYGLDFFVIDAWNKLEHKYSESETKYVSESLDKLAIFCEVNNVHCFLVAHPRKINKEKDGIKYQVPVLYDIAGSAHFYNKSDNGICVYRDFENKKTMVFIQKVKFSHWGEIGCAEFNYDLNSGRYFRDYNDKKSLLNRKQSSLYEEMQEYVNNKNKSDNEFTIF